MHYDDARIKLAARLTELGFTLLATRVGSEAKKGETPFFTWSIVLSKNGRAFMITEYGKDIGHADLSKIPAKDRPVSWGGENMFQRETRLSIIEAIRTGKNTYVRGFHLVKWPNVDLTDVFHGLLSNSYVLDSGGFENWAAELGYDLDSRKAYGIYTAILEESLKLRGVLSESEIAELREYASEM